MTPSPMDADGTVIRMAVLDEYPVLVDGIVRGLGRDARFRVVTTATTGDEILATLARRPCDVLLVEPWLRSRDGPTAIREVGARHPRVTIVAFSRLWDAARVEEALALGAHAYIPKTTPITSLADAVRAAMEGMVIRPTPPRRPDGVDLLTTREMEILALIARGCANREIARTMFITERTVKFHLHNAYRKLGARNRTHAADIARRGGIIRY